jgi:protein NirF
MNRRKFLGAAALAGGFAIPVRAAQEIGAAPRGTGDLGIVIERANGAVLVVETTGHRVLGRIEGLGDLSHASAVFSRDERYAYVFGRDGGLSKIDLLAMRIDKRIVQAGNAIGGAISDDGTLVAASNYDPGGVKVFDAVTLAEVAAIPAIGANGKASKTVGLVDIPGRRFVYTLYDAGEIWIADFSTGATPVLTKYTGAGALPYDANITADGRHYFAGLFGEDGITHLDLWAEKPQLRRVFQGYNAGRDKLPVYKMPHFEGWGQAGSELVLPAAGQHEVLLLDLAGMTEKARIPVHGQPVFCVARPDGREVWINFAHPANDTIQILDVPTRRIVHTFQPGPAVLHLEFTPRGHEVWISVRDSDRIDVMDVRRRTKVAEIAARKPSGILFTARAHRLGM